MESILNQMADLFDREATVATVQTEGKRTVTRLLKFFNLHGINPKRDTQFRIWAGRRVRTA